MHDRHITLVLRVIFKYVVTRGTTTEKEGKNFAVSVICLDLSQIPLKTSQYGSGSPVNYHHNCSLDTCSQMLPKAEDDSSSTRSLRMNAYKKREHIDQIELRLRYSFSARNTTLEQQRRSKISGTDRMSVGTLSTQ